MTRRARRVWLPMEGNSNITLSYHSLASHRRAVKQGLASSVLDRCLFKPGQTRTHTMQKLDFREKLIQTGKRENTDALLKRIKVGLLALSPRAQESTTRRDL